MTIEEKFWSMVDKDGPIPKHMPHLGKCWIWKGNCLARGYAQLFFKGKTYRAARWIYKKIHGDISNHIFVCHHCDNKICVRDSHLFKGTHQDNVDDMIKKGRNHTKFTIETVLHIRNSIADGSETIDSLAKKYKTSFQCVYHAATGRTWGHVGGPILEIKSKKFTPEEIKEIRNCSREKGAGAILAKKLGVHPSVVYHIRNGKRHPNK